MSTSFSELAAKYAQLNACEMAIVCESEMEFYLKDGEGPGSTDEEAEQQRKHLGILSDLYHQKGGWIAQMTLQFILPSNAQVEVETLPFQGGFIGYVSWQRHNIEFPVRIHISTGDCCLLPAENVELVAELARACSIAPEPKPVQSCPAV